MLACARIGAPHTVVFGGFSADALASRLDDCQAKVVITSDGGYRRGAPSALKPAVDEARTKTRRASSTCSSYAAPARTSSGTTTWTCGGTTSSTTPRPSTPASRSTPSTRSTSCTPPAPPASPRASCTPPAATSPASAYTHWAVFDLKPETDVYWCTADIGWVTGHSYIVYGPLANGATQVIYEGTPDSPEKGRWWKIIQDYKVTDLLHRAHRDPVVHEAGPRDPRRVRHVVAADPRLGR